MTRLLTLSAALLFATAASAQMSPNFEPSAENCKKPQYSTTDACKNFLEGRSSMGTNKPAGGSVGSSQSPGNSSGGGSSSGAGSSGTGGSN